MCILFMRRFDKGSYPFKLVIAFNRDEDVGRRTEKLHKWKLSDDLDSVYIYSGVDKEKSGTWLALSSDGRLCCVTNNREAPYQMHPEISRGNQVVEFFQHNSNCSFTEHLLGVSGGLSNSNFVYGSLLKAEFDFFEIKAGKCRSGKLSLEQSFVLANGGIDSQWSKQKRGRLLFDHILSEPKPIDELCKSLLQLLHDRTECQSGLPTNTVLREDEERKASAIFIDPFDVDTPSGDTIRLATRSSTVVLVTHEGHCTILEETPGQARVTFSFDFST